MREKLRRDRQTGEQMKFQSGWENKKERLNGGRKRNMKPIRKVTAVKKQTKNESLSCSILTAHVCPGSKLCKTRSF